MHPHVTAPRSAPSHGTRCHEASGTQNRTRVTVWLHSWGLLGAAAAGGGSSHACANKWGQTSIPSSAPGTLNRHPTGTGGPGLAGDTSRLGRPRPHTMEHPRDACSHPQACRPPQRQRWGKGCLHLCPLCHGACSQQDLGAEGRDWPRTIPCPQGSRAATGRGNRTDRKRSRTNNLSEQEQRHQIPPSHLPRANPFVRGVLRAPWASPAPQHHRHPPKHRWDHGGLHGVARH